MIETTGRSQINERYGANVLVRLDETVRSRLHLDVNGVSEFGA